MYRSLSAATVGGGSAAASSSFLRVTDEQVGWRSSSALAGWTTK
jgi:hypothetical protein